MRLAAPALLACVLCFTACARAEDQPYDAIRRSYAPYMTPDDPLSLPMKVKAVAQDPYTFWRGTKDLYYAWCAHNAADWISDKPSYLPTHGDLHLGNIGAYACEGAFGRIAFGMIDFDESATLPFQLELLQGQITLELTAHRNRVDLTKKNRPTLLRAMLEGYSEALRSRQNATALLKDDPQVKRLSSGSKKSYDDELEHYTAGGKFRAAVLSKKGEVRDLQRPCPDRSDEFARLIAQALSRSDSARALFAHPDAQSLRKGMKDVVLRTRLGSSGSQGLQKYLLLMDRPLVGVDHDVILYLKREIPSAAIRSGLLPADPREPGERYASDVDRLTEPHPFLNLWCAQGKESFHLTIKDPWSAELGPDGVDGFDSLLRTARLWGVVAGAAHRNAGNPQLILAKLTPQLSEELLTRGDQYIEHLNQTFAQFSADDRVRKDIDSADAAIHQLSSPKTVNAKN